MLPWYTYIICIKIQLYLLYTVSKICHIRKFFDLLYRHASFTHSQLFRMLTVVVVLTCGYVQTVSRFFTRFTLKCPLTLILWYVFFQHTAIYCFPIFSYFSSFSFPKWWIVRPFHCVNCLCVRYLHGSICHYLLPWFLPYLEYSWCHKCAVGIHVSQHICDVDTWNIFQRLELQLLISKLPSNPYRLNCSQRSTQISNKLNYTSAAMWYIHIVLKIRTMTSRW